MKLFIYDHCPYCVKARMIFGLKNIPIEQVTLLNDDEETPISLIGQKMVPILEYTPGKFMPESMDIVQFIDKKYPPVVILKKEDTSLFEIFEQARTAYYSLVMPRWVDSAMEEFKTSSARKYFQNKKEKMIGPFDEALENTEQFTKEIAKVLLKIEDKFLQKTSSHLTNLPTAGNNSQKQQPENQWYLGKQISFNDFHLFALLRSLTIVKDLPFPPALESYMNHCSAKTQIPLSKNMAL